MAVSTNRDTAGRVLSISWYDFLLGAVPVAFLLPLVAAVVLSVPFHLAIAVGAAVSLLFVIDALVVHPPIDPS